MAAGSGSAAFPRDRVLLVALLLVAAAGLAYGTWRDPAFWITAERRGDHLMADKHYRAAAAAYADPWHIGVAQYRNGDFEAAAHTFARVPGAAGAFNQGNAWLMHGKYDAAMASYDRALGFRPGWAAAVDNKALAAARKKRIEDAGKDRDQESAEAYKPDDLAFDQKGDNGKEQPRDLNVPQLSDAELRATWLRRVQTTPGDFLRAKFAYQAAQDGAQPTPEEPQ